MEKYEISPIGFIRRINDQTLIEILPEYSPALKELETFSHIQIIWWFSKFDDARSRKTTQFDKMPLSKHLRLAFSPVAPQCVQIPLDYQQQRS